MRLLSCAGTGRLPEGSGSTPRLAPRPARAVSRSPSWNRVVFVEQAGAAVVRELHVSPLDKRRLPANGITVGQIRRSARKAFYEHARNLWEREFYEDEKSRPDFEALSATTARGRPGKPGNPDWLYAKIAVRFEQLLDTGSKTPSRKTGRGVPLSTPTNARHADQSPPTQATRTRPGRAEGKATAKAREAVGQEDL